MTTLHNDTRITVSELWLSAVVDNEIVLMHIETGDYFSIEGSGVEIWQQLQHDIDFKSLCQNLMADFDISEEECVSASSKFINELLEKDIIKTI